MTTTQPRPHSPLAHYLQQIYEIQQHSSRPELSVHGYVLRRGRLFNSSPLTPDEQAYIDQTRWHEHKIKQCYRNAQFAVLTLPSQQDMTLLYVEGFINIGYDYGIHHAWLSLNAKVVDTTVRTNPDEPGRDRDRPMGTFPDGWEYYGVEFDPVQYLSMTRGRNITPLLDDWENRWPLIAQDPPETDMTIGATKVGATREN